MSQNCACGKKRPSFGKPGDKKATWCKDCPTKPADAEDITHKKCVCGKARPSLGKPGDKKATWCKECPTKPADAKNVIDKKCVCGIAKPSLGLPGDKLATWCKKCPDRPKNARNVIDDKCVCGVAIPSFGKPGDKKPTWCKKCPNRPQDTENIISKKCECGKAQPNFGDGTNKWCKNCPTKPDDAKDIKHKKCVCGKARPTFGIEGCTKAIWCKDCPDKPKNSENILAKKCVCGLSIPTFGIAGTTDAIWCRKCPEKPSSSEDVINRRCLSTWCSTHVGSDRYKGYCLPCFAHLFPTEKVLRNYKTKERLLVASVKQMLESEFPHLEVTYDKNIEGGCSTRRPDIFIDGLTHVLFGECDEGQHRREESICENKRLMVLMKDTGTRPIICIRLNPDAYIDASGKQIASCFGKTKAGNIIIRDSAAWEARVNVFLERVRYHLKNIPTKEVQVEHLFFDGYA